MNTIIPDAREQHLPQAENAVKSLLFISLLTGSFYLASRLGQWQAGTAMETMLQFGAIGLLAIASAMLVLAMAILAHEAQHRVLFRHLPVNDAVGGLLSAVGLIPYYANRQFHLTHHRYSHQPELDPEHHMHSRSFWFAFLAGPHVGIFLQHKLFLANALRSLHDKKLRSRTLKDSLFLLSAGAYYAWLLPEMGISLLYSALPTLLVFPLVFSVRAMSDHYGIPVVPRKSRLRQQVHDDNPADWRALCDQRRIQASGWVVQTPRWLEWLWSHVNYHEVHHKYPYLSHCHLKRVYQQTCGHQPYIVANGYWRNLLALRRQPYYGNPDN